MNQIKKYVPNAITCLNLLAGSIAAVSAIEGLLLQACWFILVAAVFDFLDGFAARGLGAYSLIGKELDSLADVVSFGFAPSCLVFTMLRGRLLTESVSNVGWLPYIAFLVVVFSALRLAKFNIDDRQTTSFVGLPTPANALFWVGVASNQFSVNGFELSLFVLVCLTLLFSALLVVELPMFSLKVKGFSFRLIYKQLFLLFSGIVFLYLFGLFGLSMTILLYVISSLFVKWFKLD